MMKFTLFAFADLSPHFNVTFRRHHFCTYYAAYNFVKLDRSVAIEWSI